MMEIERRFSPCPECGDEKGTTPTCNLCLQYNPQLRKQIEAEFKTVKPKERKFPAKKKTA